MRSTELKPEKTEKPEWLSFLIMYAGMMAGILVTGAIFYAALQFAIAF